jgi:hypothetical protein
MEKQEAQAALGAIGDAKQQLAAAAECPAWRHAAFGALMGAIVLSQGVNAPYSFVLLAGSALAGTLIYQSDRRRMGMFINGYRKGATRPLTFLLLGVMLAIGWAEFHARHAGFSLLTRLALAGFAAVIAGGMSAAWQRTFRREMGLDR